MHNRGTGFQPVLAARPASEFRFVIRRGITGKAVRTGSENPCHALASCSAGTPLPCGPRFPRYIYPTVPKRIAILGSTGSIGASALDVLRHLGPGYQVTALSAHSQGDKLIEQMREFSPAAVAVTDESQAARVRAQAGTKTKIYAGPTGLVEIVTRDA